MSGLDYLVLILCSLSLLVIGISKVSRTESSYLIADRCIGLLALLDLSDLLFEKRSYNKYTGYANAKRALVILSEPFQKKYPQYLFSSMHPGWVDTPGVRYSMPLFKKLLNKQLRSSEESADTILWLATTDDYSGGKFWFDRKQAKTTFLI